MRDIHWAEVRVMRDRGIKVTHTALYEMQNCRDKSIFVIVKDHPFTPNCIMRIWPAKPRIGIDEDNGYFRSAEQRAIDEDLAYD